MPWTAKAKAVWVFSDVYKRQDNSIALKAKRIVRLSDGRIVYDGDASSPQAVVTPQEED